VFAPAAIGAADDTFVVAIASEATAAIAIANLEALIIIRPPLFQLYSFATPAIVSGNRGRYLKLVDP
jgi:hypothetical protein